MTLCGADTILAQDLARAPQPGPNPDGPELIVTDRRGRIDDVTLELMAAETLDGGLVWLRHRVSAENARA